MSKVSLKNELLPSFEPIEQKGTSQKRKRSSNTITSSTAAALKDVSSNNEGQPATKKSRAKKTSSTSSNTPSVTITKSVIWIGATLMENDIKNEEISAAYCIYYGLNDSRNCTKKITIQQNLNLDHVYTLGVIRALENCEDDSSTLSIHTGSKLLETVIEEKDAKGDSEICNQIKEKIAKRKGSTSIRYKAPSSSNNQDEYQFAHNLAAEKLLEDKMMVDDEETLVDSLEVTETTTNTNTNTEVSITVEETTITTDKQVEKTVVTTMEEEKEEEEVMTTTTTTVEPLPSPSWAKTLSLRNLLDILKAPFYRNNKQK